MSPLGPGPWVDRWLSAPRAAVYLAAAANDQQRTLDLYEWNTSTSMALMHDLAHLEVGLRNAYDRALQLSAPSGQHWTEHPALLFPVANRRANNGQVVDRNLKSRQQVEKARREALEDVQRAAKAAYNQRYSSPAPGVVPAAFVQPIAPPPGKVIAQITFGFWRYMTANSHEKTVWVPYLNAAYAPGTNRSDVDRIVERVHRIRNRVAHHEPLLRPDPATGVLSLSTQPIEARYADLLDLAGLFDTDLHSYIATKSALPGWLQQCP